MSAQPVPSVLDRVPPHNIEAEMAVLGSILVDRTCFDVVVEVLQASFFYAHVHETLYDVLLELYDAGEPIDKIAVAEVLRRRDALARVGGLAYLNTLMDTVQTAGSAKFYATVVREKAVLRGLISAGTEITQLGFEGELDVKAALDQAQSMVLAIGEHQTQAQGYSSRESSLALYTNISSGRGQGISTGLRYVDEAIGGFKPGKSYVLAARPGMGKTALAVRFVDSMARVAADRDGGPVLFFSLEMSHDEIAMRHISMFQQLDMRCIEKGDLRPAEWDRLGAGMEAYTALPIITYDRCSYFGQVLACARRTHRKAPVTGIVIDYLQLLHSDARQRWGNRNEEVSQISWGIKELARELGVPVLTLSQLNRNFDSRGDKRPTLSDLRDSGAIEQDADLVMFIHREHYYNKQADPYDAELIIEKQRNGPTPTVPLRWVPEFGRFDDVDAG